MPYLVNKNIADLKYGKKYGSILSLGSCIGLFILVISGVILYYRHKEKKIKDSVINYVKKEELYSVEDYLKKKEIEREEEIQMIQEYFEHQALSPQDKTMEILKKNDPKEIEHFIDETIAERMSHEQRVPRN